MSATGVIDEADEAEVADASSITFSGLEPQIAQLGLAVGLLQTTATAGTYSLNVTWFENPLKNTKAALTANGQGLAGLLEAVLGSLGGTALGIPAADTDSLGTWYPILNPSTGLPTGLYLVAQTLAPNTIFGLGVNHTWELTQTLSVRAWALAPLIAITGNSVESAYSITPEAALTVGIETVSSTPLVSAYGLELGGMRLSGSLVPGGDASIALVAVGLQLPGETQPSDRSLADVEQLTGAQILSTVSTVFVAAMSEALSGNTANPTLGYVLPVLGLSPVLPATVTTLFPDVQMPVLRWDEIVEQAIAGSDLGKPFKDWFNTLLSDGQTMQAWLASIQGLEGLTVAAGLGDGSRTNPWSVEILNVGSVGTLSFTFATTTDASGVRTFYPGLEFAGLKYDLGGGAALRVSAELEMAQFVLAPGSTSVSIDDIEFDLGIQLVGSGQTGGVDNPLFSGNIGTDSYTFGALAAGLRVSDTTGTLSVVPSFRLTKLVTPNGTFASLDLLDPGQVVNAAETVLVGLVNSALQTLFGTTGNGEGTPAYALAALLGVMAPGTGAAGAWPIAPPLSAAQILDSLQSPVAALESYYYQVVNSSATLGGQSPFFYMVREAATLLDSVTGRGTPTVTGTGTAADPWLAPIASTGSLTANVTAYTAKQTDGSQRLVLGFGLALPFSLPGGLIVDLTIDLGLLGLGLTATSATAQVLPGLELSVMLPHGYTSPQLGGTSVAVGATGLQVGWSPYTGWSWSAEVGKPVLTTGGKQFQVGQDMVFTEASSLEQLITQEAEAFGQVLTGVLGLAVIKADQTAGLAFAGLLGLLPDLGQLMPAGLNWPSNMPVLTVTSFSDPLGLLWNQIAALAGNAASLQAGLGLLAWASTGRVQTIAGAGTVDNPFFVPMGLASGIGLAVWTDSTSGTIGFGLDRSATASITTGVQATTRVTLRLLSVSLATGKPATVADVPGARIECTLSNPAGQLLPPTPDGTSLDSISVGIDLSVAGTLQSPSLTVTPEFNLYNLVLQNQAPVAVVSLAAPGTLTLGLVQAAFNAALSVVLPDAVKTQPFGEVYDLMGVMGLAVAQDSGQPLGINPTGWNALLADPLMFASDRLLALASDPANQAALFKLIQQATGVTLPTVPPSVLELLSALGVLQGGDAGYVPIPAALVQIFSHPVQFLQTEFSALLGDSAALADLLAVLQQTSGITGFGPFALQILSGPVVSLSIPPGKVNAGGLLGVSGSLNLALNSGSESLTLAMELYNPQVKIALEPTLTVSFSGQASFAASLAFGDGTVPAPAPLQVWPFDASTFVPALAGVAPFYALSVLVSEAVDPLLLQPYPLVQALFEIFGIATKDSSGNWHTKSLLGLFQDPVGWLLSDAILGQNGQLQIGKLNKLFSNVPAVTGASGLSLAQVTNGIALSGLPYDLAVTLTADPASNQVALTPSLAKPLSIGGGTATLDTLSFGLTLGSDFQPGFTGSIRAGLTSPALSVTAGYADGFTLAVAAGSPNTMTLQLVPFAGWQSLVESAAPIVIQTLVQELTSKLMTALSSAGAGTFVTALQKAATDLSVSDLVNALVAAGADPTKLEAAALNWLGQRVTTANAPSTASAIATLLTPVVSNVGSQGGLVTYTGPASLPVTLMLGLNAQSLVGVWASIALPPVPGVEIAIQTTGIGLPVSSNGSVGTTPQISFGVSIGVAIEGEAQYPTLSVAYDNGGFFTATLDPMGGGNSPSSLAVELLPKFFGDPANLAIAVEDWLLSVLEQAVPRYLSLVVLNQSDVKKWLTSPLLGTQPGSALVSAGLLAENSGVFALPTFEALSSLTVTGVLTGLAKSLLGSTFTVLTFNDGQGKIVVGPSSTGAGDCGILVVAQNVALPGTTRFSFQIGAADSKWITDAGGPQNLAVGFGIFVPVNPSLDFSGLKVQLVNVGVDFLGANGAPLVEMSRFSLGAVQPRAVLAFDFSKGFAPVVWGGAMTLADVALSLAPSSITTGRTNPVAQNLLGSGSSNGGGGSGGQAANPAFSIRAGYISGGHLLLDLLEDGQESQEVWIPVQRSFGPLHVNMIGLELATTDGETRAGVGFDGSVQLAGLEVDVQQLTVSLNLQAPTDYSQYELDLAGIDISFQSGSVALTGAFYKEENPLQYTGAALLKFGTFSLAALGSYAVIPVTPSLPACQQNPNGPNCPQAASLFIFVNLNAILGGPPAFVVVGVAAGFGYNRNIIIPPVSDIATFPFVAGAMSGSFFPPEAKSDPSTALKQISANVPPMIGAYWIAAGVKFTSFELLTSFALLFVKFGQNFEIDLIGVSAASLPPGSPETLVYVELGLLVSFRPADGVLSVQAQLTPNSYLLAPSCQLTGGFALIIWFSGDFVVTLGGYHPAYKVPSNYPLVPRLGFNWPVDVSVGSLSIAGGAYFALTPTAIMAGGYLQVAFTLGPIKAWLNAGADFLIQWKPFYYDIGIYVSIGVSFHCKILGVSITISASLGASLYLWGPSTAGYAEVDWYVISFTIPIGRQDKDINTDYLGTWSDFATNFLPPDTAASASPAPPAAMAAAVGAPPPQPPGKVLKLSVVKGMASGAMGVNAGTNTADAWVMHSSGWQLRVDTAVPATAMQANALTFTGGPAVGVRPMNVPSATTPLIATLQGWNAATNQWQTIDLAAYQITAASLTANAPNALWAQNPMNLETPPTGPTVIAGVFVGLTITGNDVTLDDPIGPIPLQKAFQFQPAPVITVPPAPGWTAPALYDQTNALARLMATIMDGPVVTMRDAVLAAVRAQGYAAMEHPRLPVVAAYADALYQAPPTLAAVGTGITSSASMSFAALPRQAAPVAAVAPQPAPPMVRLIGAANRYLGGHELIQAPDGAARLQLQSARVTGRWVEKTRRGVAQPFLNAFRTGQEAFASQEGAAPPAAESVQVFEGTAALVGLHKPLGSIGRVDVQGAVPVRLIELNEHDEVVGDKLVAPGIRAILGSDTVKAALCGVAGQATRLTGWQRTTMLTQVGRYSFVGEGCTVRPQAPPEWKQHGKYVKHGLMEAAHVLRENTVQVRGASVPGWVETVLEAPIGSVAVSVRAESLEEAKTIEVRMAWSAEAWSPVYEEAARAETAQVAPGGVILHFKLPAAPANMQAKWLGVLVSGPLAASLEGVWGVPDAAEETKARWSSLRAPAAGIALGGAEPASSEAVVAIDAAADGTAPFGSIGQERMTA